MATTSIRSAVKQALFDILSPVYATLNPPVETSYGWPGREVEADEVYIVGPAPGTGSEAYPVMMAGRKQRDDIFVVSVVMSAVVLGQGPHEADVRAELLFSTLEDTLAMDQSLNNLDGVISVLLGPAVSGPDGEVLPIGARATIVADVTVHSRLH